MKETKTQIQIWKRLDDIRLQLNYSALLVATLARLADDRLAGYATGIREAEQALAMMGERLEILSVMARAESEEAGEE